MGIKVNIFIFMLIIFISCADIAKLNMIFSVVKSTFVVYVLSR